MSERREREAGGRSRAHPRQGLMCFLVFGFWFLVVFYPEAVAQIHLRRGLRS